MQHATPTVKTGFLLQRAWFERENGLEIRLYFASDSGPIEARFSGQKAVCFIPSEQPASGAFTRKSTDLHTADGVAVDACYFNGQRQLEAFAKAHPHFCFEADIKPADRFLMERFIKAGVRIEGEFRDLNGLSQCLNPKLIANDEHSPSLRLISLDIETASGVLSIAMQNNTQHVVFMARAAPSDTATPEDVHIIWCQDEAACLSQAFAWLRETDPDVIIGWHVVDFDLAFLQKRAQLLGVDFALGRNAQIASVLPPSRNGQNRVARIPGRAVLDGISLLRAAFWSFESFALDAVANVLLGEKKLIQASGQDKVREIQRQFHQQPVDLARYNLQDCVLVTRIFEKADLIAFAMARSQMTGLALDRMGGSVAAFDHLYLPHLHRKGQVARSMAQVSSGENSPGGYVMNSRPGLFRNIVVLDFKSLYPSIIRTFLIDPAGLTSASEHSVPGFRDAHFSRSNPILPAIITELWQARDRAKAENNTPLSTAIKIIMNSFYGVLGSSGCRFFDPALASSITLRGHQIITQSEQWFSSRGLSVIYGDTDSLFVKLESDLNAAQCKAQGEALRDELNRFWRQKIEAEFALQSHLEIEFETHFERFWMPTIRHSEVGSKKRYAGLVRPAGAEAELVIKGLESVRSDWTPLAQDFQRKLLWSVLNDQSIERYCAEVYQQLINGELDALLFYKKRIRRALSAYQKNIPPHIQAARKAGVQSRQIRYAITRNGPEAEGHLSAQFDYEHYASRQLAPIADALLSSSSFAELTAAQMRLF